MFFLVFATGGKTTRAVGTPSTTNLAARRGSGWMLDGGWLRGVRWFGFGGLLKIQSLIFFRTPELQTASKKVGTGVLLGG